MERGPGRGDLRVSRETTSWQGRSEKGRTLTNRAAAGESPRQLAAAPKGQETALGATIDTKNLRPQNLGRRGPPHTHRFILSRNHHQAARSHQWHQELTGLSRRTQKPRHRQIMGLPPRAFVAEILSPAVVYRHAVFHPGGPRPGTGKVTTPLAGIDKAPPHSRKRQSQQEPGKPSPATNIDS